MILNSLQQDFTAFVDRQPALPVLAPAFFFEEMFVTTKDAVAEPISDHLPFDTFWFVYQSSNGVAGTIQNFALVRDREVRLWIISSHDKKLVKTATFDLDDPASGEYRFSESSIRETLPELRLAIDKVMNHEQETGVPPFLKRLNKARNKAQAKSIPPYITVKANRIVRPSVATGEGTPQRPHMRSGYTRVMKKSGKRIEVQSYAVHGGTNAPRDYRVKG